MRRLLTALSASVVAAITGCASTGAPAGRVTSSGTSHANQAPSTPAGAPSHAAGSAMVGGPPRTPGLLQGKYQALAIAFPSRDTGIAAILGYAGQSTTLRSWIERTTDRGRHWAARRSAIGQHQPGARAGMAFVSAQQGWAYLPGLFFTRDGGVTWQAEPTPFPITGPVAVAGTSTWVAGYACTLGHCPATIYATSRVGGALRRLPNQPAAAGSVAAMQRPAASVA